MQIAFIGLGLFVFYSEHRCRYSVVENAEWCRHRGNKVGVVVYVTILVVGATETEDPTPAETAVKDYDKQQIQKRIKETKRIAK